MKLPVVSLYDYTGDACRPWAEAGHPCFCFDLKHTEVRVEGNITFIPWNVHRSNWFEPIRKHVGEKAWLVMGWPPCDDLAGCGAKHFAGKLAKDPECQNRAALRAKRVELVAHRLGTTRWLAENPSGVLPRFWRKWDFTFHPHQYGAYLPKRDRHPKWPQYIPARDAYKKLTCIWHGADFKVPERKSVEPEILEGMRAGAKAGFNRQTKKLGGRSEKTKEIRSSGPRGFSLAVYLANRQPNA